MILASVFGIALDATWIVPLVGICCFVAAVVGWRLFAGRHSNEGPAEVPLKSFLDGVTTDRRCIPRRRGNAVEVQLTDGGDGPPVRGYVLDRSQGGLRLLVDEAIAEGTAWKIRPSMADQTTPWTDVTVRSCRRDGMQFELGCQFAGMPNWSLLMQFG